MVIKYFKKFRKNLLIRQNTKLLHTFYQALQLKLKKKHFFVLNTKIKKLYKYLKFREIFLEKPAAARQC